MRKLSAVRGIRACRGWGGAIGQGGCSRRQLIADQRFDLVPDFGIAFNFGVRSGEEQVVPGIPAAVHRNSLISQAEIAKNLGAAGIGGGDLGAAVDKSVGLVEVHSLANVGGDHRVVLAGLGDTVHLRGEQHGNAVALETASQQDNGGRSPAVAEQENTGALFLSCGKSAVVIGVQTLADKFVSLGMTAIAKDAAFNFVGVLFAQTPFKARIDEGIHPLTYSMFVPIFFISIGLQANGRELGERAAFTIVLLVVAIVAKAIGCGVFARAFGFSTQESVRVGVGMISRGEVGLIVAGYGLANNLIGRDVFSASVIMVLVTTMVTPPLLRMVFPRVAPKPELVTVEETIAGPPEEAEEAH